MRPSTAQFPWVTDPSLQWEIDIAVMLRAREILADIQEKALAKIKRDAQDKHLR